MFNTSTHTKNWVPTDTFSAEIHVLQRQISFFVPFFYSREWGKNHYLWGRISLDMHLILSCNEHGLKNQTHLSATLGFASCFVLFGAAPFIIFSFTCQFPMLHLSTPSKLTFKKITDIIICTYFQCILRIVDIAILYNGTSLFPFSKFQMSLQPEDIPPWCHCYLYLQLLASKRL